MSFIKYNTDGYSSIETSLKSINLKTKETFRDVVRVKNNLDWDVSSKESVNERLVTIEREISKQDEMIESLIFAFERTTMTLTQKDIQLSQEINKLLYSLDSMKDIASIFSEDYTDDILYDNALFLNYLFNATIPYITIHSIKTVIEILGIKPVPVDKGKNSANKTVDKSFENNEGDSDEEKNGITYLNHEYERKNHIGFSGIGGKDSLDIGISDNHKLSGSLVRGHAEFGDENANVEIEGDLGYWELEGGGFLNLFNYGAFSPQIGGKASVSGAAVKGKIKSRLANKILGTENTGEIELLGFKAGSGFRAGTFFTDDKPLLGFEIENTAMAYVAKTKATSRLEFYGLKIDFSTEKYHGAVGKVFGLRATNDGMRLRFGGAWKEGAGVDINIDFSEVEFDAMVHDAGQFIDDSVNGVRKFIGNSVNGAGEFIDDAISDSVKTRIKIRENFFRATEDIADGAVKVGSDIADGAAKVGSGIIKGAESGYSWFKDRLF